MRLFHSPTSPYVRKVMACAIARGIAGQIELVGTNPWTTPADLLAANPLSKVPCLVTDDGAALFDSPVICEFLDSVGDALAMMPAHGGPRWTALRQQAMADGIMDAAIARRMDMARPEEAARGVEMARQAAAVARTLDALEQAVPHAVLDIGSISVACALGYLDFRYAAEPWRPARPALAAWYAQVAAEPCLEQTRPPG